MPVSERSSVRPAQEFGQAEVGDLHPPLLIDQDVLGLDVPMNDPFVMGELQRVADLRHDLERLLRLEFAVADGAPAG